MTLLITADDHSWFLACVANMISTHGMLIGVVCLTILWARYSQRLRPSQRPPPSPHVAMAGVIAVKDDKTVQTARAIV
jgi:hypothetical protein